MFNRLPMGFSSTPATFQHLMELDLAGLQWDSYLIHLNDIIVFGRMFDEHLDLPQSVFVTMHAADLKFKPQKCHLQKSV